MGKVWDRMLWRRIVDFFLRQHCGIERIAGEEGLIYVGTDEGLVQVTQDGELLDEYYKFAGVPDMAYVSRWRPSRFDANTVYGTLENHKNSDFKPYVVRARTRGRLGLHHRRPTGNGRRWVC